MLKPLLKTAHTNVKTAVKYVKHVEHARLICEMAGCVFVGIETPLVLFASLCGVWFIIDATSAIREFHTVKQEIEGEMEVEVIE